MNPQKSVLTGAMALGLLLSGWASASDKDRFVYRETLDDPPAPRAARDDVLNRTLRTEVVTGPYVSRQVNIDNLGMNIVNDAANEPSIAVDPNNPDVIVIGWRQFDNIVSNFRQAGRAYSSDGGQSWIFPGVFTPGVFRSDPVLDTDSAGNFYYQSLRETFDMDVFKSNNGGVSFGPPVYAFGGDKNWMAIDKTGGTGDGHVHEIWQRVGGCCGNRTATRSIDGAQSFEQPVQPSLSPTFGVLDVGPDGTLYAAGIEYAFFQNFDQFVLARATNADNPSQPLSFTGVQVNMGGSMEISTGPNPGGLLGQAYVRADDSVSDGNGNVYMLASVNPPGSDPLDVHFIRSADGGQTFSAPLRVNSDPAGNGAWQWFAGLDVAPNGRLDAVWKDTSRSGSTNVAELYYAWSYNQGRTWSPGIPVSPSFNSFLGWPNQNKLGDYLDFVSDDEFVSVAYAATFNGEQDVYFTRLFPDCNGNQIADSIDIAQGASQDANGNANPDACEVDLAPVSPGQADAFNVFDASLATPGATLLLVRGTTPGKRSFGPCPGQPLGISDPRVVAVLTADAQGEASLSRFVPAAAAGVTAIFQFAQPQGCLFSDPVTVTF